MQQEIHDFCQENGGTYSEHHGVSECVFPDKSQDTIVIQENGYEVNIKTSNSFQGQPMPGGADISVGHDDVAFIDSQIHLRDATVTVNPD